MEGSAVPRTSLGNTEYHAQTKLSSRLPRQPWDRSVAQWRDLRFSFSSHADSKALMSARACKAVPFIREPLPQAVKFSETLMYSSKLATHNPIWADLTKPARPPALKNKLQSLSTRLKNRTTVEIEIHMPVSSHRDGAARLCTELLYPCRRHQPTDCSKTVFLRPQSERSRVEPGCAQCVLSRWLVL